MNVMKNGYVSMAGAACTALAHFQGAAQAQQLETQEHLNVQMMVESVLHGVRQELADLGLSDAQLQVNGSYTQNGFQADITGQAGGLELSAEYTGTLSQTAGGWYSSVLGEGTLGEDIWISEIEGVWEAEGGKVTNLYYFETATSPLDKPKWWVYAGEIIAGGAIGSIGGPGVGTVVGAGAAVNISNAVSSAIAAPPLPPVPTGPIVVSMDPAINVDQIVVVVAGTGQVTGNNGNLVRFDGAWSETLLVGAITVGGQSCYADCDASGSLDFFDFLCFQNEFASASAFADCDASGSLDFFDFLCFQNEFAAGCP